MTIQPSKACAHLKTRSSFEFLEKTIGTLKGIYGVLFNLLINSDGFDKYANVIRPLSKGLQEQRELLNCLLDHDQTFSKAKSQLKHEVEDAYKFWTQVETFIKNADIDALIRMGTENGVISQQKAYTNQDPALTVDFGVLAQLANGIYAIDKAQQYDYWKYMVNHFYELFLQHYTPEKWFQENLSH